MPSVGERRDPAYPPAVSEAGFSLIELMIALLLLLVGLLAVITVFWSSASSGVFTRKMTTAASLGQEILEQAKTRSYNSLPTSVGFVDYTTANSTASGFTRKWSITENGGTKTVTVSISWKDGSGTRNRTFSMTKRADY